MTKKSCLAGCHVLFSPRIRNGPEISLATEQAKVTVSFAAVWGSALNNKLQGNDPPMLHCISGVFISGT
jgi:hypothetical protein